MANAVLVVDMLKGFMEKRYPLYCGDKARRIIPRIAKLLESELRKGSKIYFVCDRHAPDDLEFNTYPPHSITGTEEAEIIPELRGYPGEVIAKNRYSCFFNTTLDDRLNEFKPDRLIICGVCTDICILHTVGDARNRDYEVEVPGDCVATFNESVHECALEHMKKSLGARLVSVE